MTGGELCRQRTLSWIELNVIRSNIGLAELEMLFRRTPEISHLRENIWMRCIVNNDFARWSIATFQQFQIMWILSCITELSEKNMKIWKFMKIHEKMTEKKGKT